MPLTRRIVPCLDVSGGRVVKGTRFVSTRDAGDPVELAARYGEQGADELVFLDITASEERRRTITALVRDVAAVLDIPFTVGGGVSELRHARDILLSGADKVAINTGAVRDPSVLTGLMDLFGRQCVVVAIDAKRNYNLGGGAEAAAGAARGWGGEDGAGIEGPVHVRRDADGRPFWFEVHVYGGKRPVGIDAVAWAARAGDGRRRGPPHEHRPGRHKGRVRPGAHVGRVRLGRDTRRRIRGMRQAGAHGRGPCGKRRRGRCGPCRIDIPLRLVRHRSRQAVPARCGRSGAPVTAAAKGDPLLACRPADPRARPARAALLRRRY